MDRKDFLKNCGLICVGGLVLPAVLESCGTSNYYAQVTTAENQMTIKKSEFINLKKKRNAERKYILVKSPQYNYPIYVTKVGNEYIAVLLECTHKGCEVEPLGDFLHCPCHGSEFTKTGVVKTPPADKNLRTFTVTTDNENLYINL